MELKSHPAWRVIRTVFLATAIVLVCFGSLAQSNVTVRIMAANLSSGSNQRYELSGLNIFKGLKPDIVCIQEFNYASTNGLGTSTPAAMREMIDTTFGTNFYYFRESGYSIPNGIISRWPILTNGSWMDSDPGVNDRGFAWARIDLPGTNELYVVSVHLKASSGSDNPTRRAAQAAEVTSNIQTNFINGTNAWIIVAGDMNLYDESEGAINTFKTFLSDSPVPVDQGGDSDTNAGRSERYDRVLASFSFTNKQVPVVIGANTFANGLVFDSRVYSPLSAVSPVQTTNSGAFNMQHMGVVKDFQITYTVTNAITVPPPLLAMPTADIIRWFGVSNLVYTVQTKTNLDAASWLTLGTATSTTTNVSFTNSNIGTPQRFYRVTYP